MNLYNLLNYTVGKHRFLFTTFVLLFFNVIFQIIGTQVHTDLLLVCTSLIFIQCYFSNY